jgi:membrane protease YdiL (CAAX protease family)
MTKSANSDKSVTPLENVFRIWGWILLVWCLYRYLFRLPEPVDEFIFKPLIFVLPVFWYVLKKENRGLESIGLSGKNLFSSIYIGLGFGAVFAIEGIIVNTVKYGALSIKPITSLVSYGLGPLFIISIATAFSEELLNRGFLFNRIFEYTKKLEYSAFLSALLFVLLHVPILVTALHLKGLVLIIFFVTNFILGFVNSLLFANKRTIIAPMLVHVFWNMTVALYL